MRTEAGGFACGRVYLCALGQSSVVSGVWGDAPYNAHQAWQQQDLERELCVAQQTMAERRASISHKDA